MATTGDAKTRRGMNMNPRIQKMYEQVNKDYKQTNLTLHGIDDIGSVLKYANEITKHEKGVNIDVVQAASILRYIKRLHVKGDEASLEERYLKDFSEEEKRKIIECVNPSKKNERPKSTEAKIVHDADYLIFASKDYLSMIKDKYLKELQKINTNVTYHDVITQTAELMRAYLPEGEYHTEHGKKLGNKGFKSNLENLLKEADKMSKEDKKKQKT